MTSEAPYSFKQAKHYRKGRVSKIKYAVVHATVNKESASGTGAEAIQQYFATSDRVASAHVTVDQNSKARSVHDWDTAYASKNFNANGLHVEIYGMPDQTRAQWLDPISKATLLRAAEVVADWCLRYGLLQSYVSLADLKAGRGTGITFHADCDKAVPSTGHWDPGPNFPRDVFLQMVKDAARRMQKPAANENPYMNYLEAADSIYRDASPGEIRGVQWALGLPIDGVWDGEVETAVRALQRRHGREMTGVVVGWTLEYLKTISR